MSTQKQSPSAGIRSHSVVVLIGLLAACFLVAGVSSTFSVSAIPKWYAALSKPSFNPPNWIFGPVWTLLYALMAIAAWLVWKEPMGAPAPATLRTTGLRLWWLQLLLNFAWSWIFFHQHQLAGALFEIVLLWLAIVTTTVLFLKVNRLAAWLMLPYIAWVGFASLLNYEIWRLNAV